MSISSIPTRLFWVYFLPSVGLSQYEYSECNFANLGAPLEICLQYSSTEYYYYCNGTDSIVFNTYLSGECGNIYSTPTSTINYDIDWYGGVCNKDINCGYFTQICDNQLIASVVMDACFSYDSDSDPVSYIYTCKGSKVTVTTYDDGQCRSKSDTASVDLQDSESTYDYSECNYVCVTSYVENNKSKSNNSSTNTLVITLIVAGIVVGLLCIGNLIYRNRKKNNNNTKYKVSNQSQIINNNNITPGANVQQQQPQPQPIVGYIVAPNIPYQQYQQVQYQQQPYQQQVNFGEGFNPNVNINNGHLYQNGYVNSNNDGNNNHVYGHVQASNINTSSTMNTSSIQPVQPVQPPLNEPPPAYAPSASFGVTEGGQLGQQNNNIGEGIQVPGLNPMDNQNNNNNNIGGNTYNYT